MKTRLKLLWYKQEYQAIDIYQYWTHILMNQIGQRGKQNLRKGITLTALEKEKSVIPIPVLRPKYEMLLEHQGFLMQRCHGMYLFVTLTKGNRSITGSPLTKL